MLRQTDTSPRLTLSQNLLNRHTLPTPRLSSTLLTPSSLSLTSPLHFTPTHRLNTSFVLSLSIAFLFAASPGATSTDAIPGTHSFGKTARSTRTSTDGLAARRRARRIETRERARRRDTTEVLVRKMERAMSSAREGRHGEERSGGRRRRLR